jgi:hypothetical protein
LCLQKGFYSFQIKFLLFFVILGLNVEYSLLT